ncbi:hypothetical protein QQZ08_002329 [Neonectria magnoliae]|uniref:MARVEL domain-containing protein n=1 Tax=Neonectria magnoliae TaxID=2732573 RepID=A0ABR1IBZ1_9HYPO
MSQTPVPPQQQVQQQGELQGDLQHHEQQQQQQYYPPPNHHQQQQQQQYQQYQQYQLQQQMPQYQQQTNPMPQFQPQATVVEVIHVSPRGMWSSKMTLRILSVIFSIILIGVCAGTMDPWALIEFCPPAGIAFIWNIADTICLCVRRGHPGIHPGACVGVDLLLWLGYIVSVTLFALFGLDGAYYYGYYNYYNSLGGSSVSAYRAIFAFGILEILVHFTLFVIACYETHVRNRNSRAQQVIYIPAGSKGTIMYPPNFPMGQTYQQPQPTYTPNQPPMQQYQQYTAPQQNHLASSEVPTTTTSPPVVAPPQNQTVTN